MIILLLYLKFEKCRQKKTFSFNICQQLKKIVFKREEKRYFFGIS